LPERVSPAEIQELGDLALEVPADRAVAQVVEAGLVETLKPATP